MCGLKTWKLNQSQVTNISNENVNCQETSGNGDTRNLVRKILNSLIKNFDLVKFERIFE